MSPSLVESKAMRRRGEKLGIGRDILMRRAVFTSLYLLIEMVFATRAYPGVEPLLEWSYNTGSRIYASPIVTDLDSDGSVEVLVCASIAKRIICFQGNGTIRWEYHLATSAREGFHATPAALDYDGDGRKEVFFADEGGVVGCLDADGRLVWRVFTGDRIDYSGPVVADIDGDGRVEIVFGADSGTLYCLDDAGQQRWHYQGDGAIRGIPAVAYDPPSNSMRIYAAFGGGLAACLSSEGRIVWSHDEPTARKERRSGPAVGDMDGDGELEVAFATEDFQVVVYDTFTGAEEWRWKGEHTIDQTNSFALADFDGSGRQDIVCGDGRGLGGPGNVYRLRNGEALWTADVGGGIVQGPSVGDVDGDGQLEILACSRSKRLICLSPDGREEWSFPSEAGILTTPALGDVDGDGEVEIVVTGKDGHVYCITVNGAYNPEHLPWPNINHDGQLSGNVDGAPFTATAPTPPSAPPDLITLNRFAPLRTGANTVAFTFFNDSHRYRHIEAVAEVARPDGGVVSETVTYTREPYENASAELGFDALESGAYALSLALHDVGTGRTLAELNSVESLSLFLPETAALKSYLTDARRLLRALPGSGVKNRARQALLRAQDEAEASLQTATNRANGSGTANHEDLKRVYAALRELERLLARLRAIHVTPVENKAIEFAVVPESTLVKVFRDEPYVTADRAACRAAVAVAGNEIEGLQLVVVPLWKDLTQLQVTVTELRHTDGSATIPPANVSVHRVGYVRNGPPMYSFDVKKRGDYPDILFPNEPSDVLEDQDAQPFFLTVRADEDTLPGDYEATVRFSVDGLDAVIIPLRVHVWGFRIAGETHLKTTMWMNEGDLKAFYEYADRTPWEVRKRFYDCHLEHRVGPLMGYPYNGGDTQEDWDYVMAHGQNTLFIPLPHHLPEADRPAFSELLKQTQADLREKSWDDQALFYTRDEVAVMGRHEIAQVVEFSHWVRSVLPEWPQLQTSAPEQALFGAMDIWCPTIDHFSPRILQDRMAKGERLWFYIVWGRPGIMIDLPATDHRLMFWECWKYGAEGFLYWGTTHWALNVQGKERWPAVPWIPWNHQRGHNGCGYLIYPGPSGTPLSSTRFENVRDGIEDYEYLYLLDELAGEAGENMSESLRERVNAELDVSPDVLTDHKHFTEDPASILAARARIAGLIEELTAICRGRSR